MSGKEKYRQAATEYAKEHPACEVHIAEGWGLVPAQDVHHIAGRSGSLLWDKENFLAVCRSCHNLIHFGANQGFGPKWAREKGYLK